MDNIPKNQIRTRNSIEQREHEDQAAARRVLPVDSQGNPITSDNRLPVDIGANLRQMILAAKDRDQDITYADFGTKNQRIIRIDYTAPSIGVGVGFTARKTLTYTLVSGRYRRDKITWSLV